MLLMRLLSAVVLAAAVGKALLGSVVAVARPTTGFSDVV